MKREADTPLDELEKSVKQPVDSQQESQPNGDVNSDNEQSTGSPHKGGDRLPPKVRVAMIVGYNGSDFAGSQKNKDVRTVEAQIEKALFKCNLISKFNYGDLKKIGWHRATRTDKSVHAL